jgi:hypothetical protein
MKLTILPHLNIILLNPKNLMDELWHKWRWRRIEEEAWADKEVWAEWVNDTTLPSNCCFSLKLTTTVDMFYASSCKI